VPMGRAVPRVVLSRVLAPLVGRYPRRRVRARE
jgi:hypothetical protein